MRENQFQKKIINHIDARMDQIEKLINLSLLNDVLSEYMEGLEEKLSDDIKQVISERNFYITKTEIFSDKVAIYLASNIKMDIKEFRELKDEINQYGGNLILVFEMESATSVQKRKFYEEKISYYIKDDELYISK